MTHKKPGSDVWDLAMRSHQLWHELADSLTDQGLDPQELLGWKKTGLFSFTHFGLFRFWLDFYKLAPTLAKLIFKKSLGGC